MNEHNIYPMELYKNKYRIPSARAPWWNYAANGWYFVTSCTQNRECFFGDVVDGEMRLSGIGRIAHACWLEIPKHFPFVQLDAFVVMPNHVHGIIVIDKPDEGDLIVGTVEIQELVSPPRITLGPRNTFGPQSKNLASIIRGFKIGVTKNARLIDPGFAWQSLYHDHIIRDKKSYRNISEYIINNPAKWKKDKWHRT